MIHTRTLRSLLPLCLAISLMAIAPAGAAASPEDGGVAGAGDSIGIRLGDVTESLKDDPRATAYIVDNMPPGTAITRHVVVSNQTNSPQDIDVYVGPAAIKDGIFTVGARGETNALTSWIAIDQASVRLDSGQDATIPVTITVPRDAPEGEFYGGIWASVSIPSADGGGISSVSRVGVRVYLSVGEGNGPPSDFTISSLTPQRDADGGATVVANINNTGGRAVDLSGTLDLTEGPGGLTANTVSSQTTTVAPGEGGKVVFALPNSASLPAGPWKAAVKLESGFNKHDSSVDITFPEKGVGDSVGAPSSLSWAAIASIVVGSLIVLLLVAAAVYILRSRRRVAAEAQPAQGTGSPDSEL